ncbi:hypothetical protein CRENBAI_021348 [Crenichthys baileyi]|uniref:Uncharacterized protein n=1 Tax=Crenichthys baileyi TaxID=28760 RepID=A0AAV9SR14_9TELE
MSQSRQTVEDPMKPMHPTSMGHVVVFQPASLRTSARSVYLAHSITSSHGTVNSTKKMVLHGFDHIIRSGRSDVSTRGLGLPPQVDPHYSLTARHLGNPNHFLMNEFAGLSIMSPAEEGTLLIFRGHITLGYTMNWSHIRVFYP